MRWFWPVLLIGTGIAGFFFVAQPTYESSADLQAEANSYKEALENSALLQQERDKLLTKYNSFSQQDLVRLNKMLPTSVDNIKLILEIEKVAADKGILVRNVQFEPDQFADDDPEDATGGTATEEQRDTVTQSRRPGGVDNSDYETYDLEFSIEGRYSEFVKFLELVESSLRIVDIYSIGFTPGTSEKNQEYTEEYRYTFRINTYRLRDN